jgi:hypothetical protein
MDRPDVTVVLESLAEPGRSAAEADALMAALDGHETDAVIDVFRWLHDTTDEGELHAAVRLFARWADRPVGQALRPALRAMVAEPGVADLNKLAAADLLEAMDEPVDRVELAARMADPQALAQQAAASALAAVADPLALVNFLDALVAEPQGLVLDLIEDLVALDDQRAVSVLAPLTQAGDPDLAISAIVALDELDAVAAVGTLVLVALHHPDETVREQADLVIRRLGEPPAGRPPAADEVAEAHLSQPDGAGGQFVILVRPQGPRRGVMTVYHTPRAGIERYVAVEGLDADGVAGLFDRLAGDGVPLAIADVDAVRGVLEAATARTIARGPTMVGYAAWPWVLGTGV